MKKSSSNPNSDFVTGQIPAEVLNLQSTQSGEHFLGDPNQLLFKTSSLALLKAKRTPQTLSINNAYITGAKRVMDFMFDLWQKNRLCDVTLTSSENETLRAHKIALGAHSSFLAEKFFDQSPGTICHINLSRFSSSVLRPILSFIYTTDFDLTNENIDSTLDCALEMRIDMLVMACKEYLCACASDSAIFSLAIAEKYGLNDIKTHVLAFVSRNISDILKTTGYLESSVSFLRHLACENVLGLASELEIFLAIVAWINYDRPVRIQYAPELIGYVRMHHMTPEVLVTRVETTHFIFAIPECHNQLYTAFKYHSLKLSGSALAKSFFKQASRQPKTVATDLTEAGRTYKQQISVYLDGNTPRVNEECYFSMERLSPEKQGSPPMRKGTHSHGESLVDSKRSLVVVAVGGIDLQSLTTDAPGKSVFCLNEALCRWEQLTQMHYSTHHHGVISIGSSIFVIGGSVFDHEKSNMFGSATRMVHAYDVITAQWRRLADMNVRRAYHAVVSHSGVIYAIGGEDENKRKLDSIEQYDVIENKWTIVARMPRGAKIGLSAAIFGEDLYVVGGYSKQRPGCPVLDEVDCFNLFDHKWKPKRPLEQPRCHANLITAHGMMYLIGGRSKLGGPPQAITSLTSIMVYDSTTDTWQKVGDLRFPRHDAGCAVIGSGIYIIGGMTTPSPHCLSSVERFDISTGLSEEKKIDLPYKASGVACCVLETML